MKCPKCSYLGFEEVERCRNCGYDFSLNSASTPPDLSLRSGQQDTERPLEDFTLLKGVFERSGPSPLGDSRSPGPRRSAARAAATPDLPLFRSADGDDLPLVSNPSAPRSPLAVRRATPEAPRLRGIAHATMFDVAALESDAASKSVPVPAPKAQTHSVTPAAPAQVSAGAVVRVIAGAIDLAVLAGIDAVVVYITLRISGLTLAEISTLPPIPLAAFLAAQNLSYFAAFTTGGQTLGQMAMSIRVISTADGRSPSLRDSAVRTLTWALLLLPAGLGLLTALFGDEGRGLHDRAAGTRVVRVADA